MKFYLQKATGQNQLEGREENGEGRGRLWEREMGRKEPTGHQKAAAPVSSFSLLSLHCSLFHTAGVFQKGLEVGRDSEELPWGCPQLG